MHKLFELFMVFFKIGAFTIGGGYAMVPLIQEEICSRKKWSSDEEFLDIIAIAQSLPGVLAVNTASILGYKLFGIPGVLAAVLGAVLPSFMIILVIAVFFTQFVKYEITERVFRGVRPAVASLMAFAVIKLGKKVGISTFNIAIGLLVAALLIFEVHPILIIVLSGIIGIAAEYWGGRSNAKADN
ncbi:MAG TPA: chromate transporter [Clostridia bacterium]|nr:chromate transporter [Clostridia bacterium]